MQASIIRLGIISLLEFVLPSSELRNLKIENSEVSLTLTNVLAQAIHPPAARQITSSRTVILLFVMRLIYPLEQYLI